MKGSVEFAAKFPYPVGIVTFMAFPEFLRTDEGFADEVRALVEDPFFNLLKIGPIGDCEWVKLVNVIKASGRDVRRVVRLQPSRSAFTRLHTLITHYWEFLVECRYYR